MYNSTNRNRSKSFAVVSVAKTTETLHVLDKQEGRYKATRRYLHPTRLSHPTTWTKIYFKRLVDIVLRTSIDTAAPHQLHSSE